MQTLIVGFLLLKISFERNRQIDKHVNLDCEEKSCRSCWVRIKKLKFIDLLNIKQHKSREKVIFE